MIDGTYDVDPTIPFESTYITILEAYTLILLLVESTMTLHEPIFVSLSESPDKLINILLLPSTTVCYWYMFS